METMKTRKYSKYRRICLFALLLITLITLSPISIAAEPVSSILSKAESLLGTPYRTGGISPGGFDCSGFVYYLYRPTIPDIPRISRDMARRGSPVAYGEWRPGDLLFYATGADPSRINHVAIWFGKGTIIHSISDGPETGVVETPSEAGYWRKRYITSRRILPEEPPAPGTDTGESSNTAAGINTGTGSDTHNTADGKTVNKEPPPAKTPSPETSPWNNFDGALRGDFDAWQQADEDAFEAFKKENG